MVDPLTIAAIGGSVASAAASIFGGGGLDFDETQKLNREADAFNAREAEKARIFQQDMSDTAYQRSRRDMEKAGLNPMLMAQQGGAAGGGGGAQASAVAPPTASYHQDAIATALSSAKDVVTTMSQLEKTRAETKQAQAQAAVTEVMKDKVIQDTKTSGSTAKKIDAETKVLGSQADVRAKDATAARVVGKVYSLGERFVNALQKGAADAKSRMFNVERFGFPTGNMKER